MINSNEKQILEEKQTENQTRTTQNAPIKKRKWWFKCLKRMMRGRYKQPTFVYLGEEFCGGSIILSNHEGTDGPMSLEIYCDKPTRMWGAHEMNSGLVKMYKYQTRVYYHEKKHWNLHLARLFCLVASPLTNLFYKGLNLISTYKDERFVKTIKESINAIKEGHNIVIYPEISDNGYLDELEGFHAGFVALAEICQRRGIDVPIYVSYFRKKDGVFIVDKPIRYSQLTANGETKEQVCKFLCDRCNELGKMEFDEEYLSQLKESQSKKSKKKSKKQA